MITIKSTSSQMEFWVDNDAAYTDVWKELCETISSKAAFYRGSTLPICFYMKKFTDAQKKEIRAYFENETGLTDIMFSDDPMEAIAEEEYAKPIVNTDTERKDLFFQGTLRSGQRLESEGNIVIVGDVNAGAELIAGENILVFGKLRGLAHAGILGSRNCIIAANQLMPQQVRLNSKIAIIPANRAIEGPEIVRIDKNGKIVVDLMS